MKSLNLIIFFICINSLFSQTSQEKKDVSSIVFRAKLFTLSKYYNKESYNSSEEQFVESINKIEANIYESENFIIINVKNKYFCLDTKAYYSGTWCDCDYYICYSKIKEVFYFLGGFENNDIEQFSLEYRKDISVYEWDKKIKDEKLSKFLFYTLVGKIKKAKKCFNVCKETWY